MKAIYNTKKKGAFHFIVYKEGQDYIAVCLNLNLIEYGKSAEEVKTSIEEAAFTHLETVRKEKLPDEYLNIPAPVKYWEKLKEAQLIRAENTEREREISSRILPVFFQVTQRFGVYDVTDLSSIFYQIKSIIWARQR